MSWLQASRTLRTSLMRTSWQTCITKSSVQDERLELSMFSHSGLSRAPIPIRVIPELILIYPLNLLQYDSNTPNTDSESAALPTMLWSSKRNKNKQKSISGIRTHNAKRRLICDQMSIPIPRCNSFKLHYFFIVDQEGFEPSILTASDLKSEVHSSSTTGR